MITAGIHPSGENYFGQGAGNRLFSVGSDRIIMAERLFYIAVLNLISFLLPDQAFSQPAKGCSCNIFKDGPSNRKPTAAQLRQMETSNDPACKARFLEQQLIALLERRKGDALTRMLLQLDTVIRNLPCTGYDRSTYYLLETTILQHAGDYAGSLDAGLRLLALEETAEDPFRLAEARLLIAGTFNRLKRSAQGRGYTYGAIAELPRIAAPWDRSRILYLLSSRYLWYYQDTKNTLLLDSAFQFSMQQLEISHSLQDTTLLLHGFTIMNGVAHERAQFETALRYIDSSIRYMKPDEYAMMGTAYGDKADALMELKRYPEARRYADSCLACHRRSGNPETIANAQALIYQISERTGNYKDALDALNAYVEIHDSLTNVSKTRTVTELEKKYNQARNEKTIKELAQQKQIYSLVALAVVLLLLAVVFYFRQKALKQKQRIMEAEQRLNRSRMNPHFFFNALASLQAFALQDTDRKELASGLSRFSHIMRETLESTYKEYVTIEQETAFLSEYLELQQLRHPGKFSFTITVAPELEPETLMLPSMILQPFAENSVEHGFEGINYPGTIRISFSSREKQLLIRMEDNGKGLTPQVKSETGHVSRAQQIVKDRIYLLKMKLKCNAGFSIRNRENGNGVVVEILLPELDKSQVNS